MQTRIHQYNKTSIWGTIKGDWFPLLCLFLSVSQISVYAKFFILPAILAIIPRLKMSRRSRSTFIWIIVFSFFYLLPYLTHLEIDSRMNYIVYMSPPIFFMIGSYLGSKYKYNESSLVIVLFVLLFVYALYYFILLTISTVLNKGAVLENRMVYDLNNKETLSATLFGLYSSVLIAGFAFVFMPKNENKLWFIRIFGIILAIIATWNMVTTITRTSIYEALIMLGLSFYMFLRNRNSRHSMGFLLGFLLLFIIGYIVVESSSYAEYLDAFQSRDEIYGHSSNTAGGRLLLWSTGLKDMLHYPLGTPFARLASGRAIGSYAHNMWIDAGLVGGLFPFLILVFLSLRNARQSLKLMNDTSYDYFTRLYFTAIFVIFFVSCFLEPVLEAIYAHFLVYLVFCGMVSELKPKY